MEIKPEVGKVYKHTHNSVDSIIVHLYTKCDNMYFRELGSATWGWENHEERIFGFKGITLRNYIECETRNTPLWKIMNE